MFEFHWKKLEILDINATKPQVAKEEGGPSLKPGRRHFSKRQTYQTHLPTSC